MFRAVSTRRSPHGYEQSLDEIELSSNLEPKLSRAKSLSGAKIFSFSRSSKKTSSPSEQASKIHPLFSLFEESRRKKKATAKAELSRYLAYVREGGVLDLGTGMPVILKK